MTEVLTARQRKFCEEYLVDFNSTRAATAAGYAERSAAVSGVRLLKNRKIQDQLGDVVERSLGLSQIQAAEVISMITRMASVDPLDIFDDTGALKPLSDIPKAARQCISGVSHGPHGVSVKLEGRLKALELMGKYLKLWTDGTNINIDAGAGPTNFVVEFNGEKPGNSEGGPDSS